VEPSSNCDGAREARLPRRQECGGQVHAEVVPSATATVADVGGASPQSSRGNDRDRLLHRSDADVRCALCLRRAVARTAADTPRERDRPEWAAQQIVETFGEDGAFKVLIRDRDGIFGAVFDRRVNNLGVRQLRIAPRSPWQNGFAERLVGTFRRELTDHMIVLNDRHLLRCVREYAKFYNADRPHMSIDADAPSVRPVDRRKTGGGSHFRASAGSTMGTHVAPPDRGRLIHHHTRPCRTQALPAPWSAISSFSHGVFRVRPARAPTPP
jgi:hypothetical protein